jgi:Tfp pilus assembly protein PilV
MRASVVALVALITLSFASSGFAQQQQQQRRSVRDMMSEMKAKHGQTYDQCASLAASRGYRVSDSEDAWGAMMFIEGCIMGQQR